MKFKNINIKEELKAWLGFNIQDLLMNISAIPFLLGFITKNIYICIISFAIAFMFMTSGLIIYLIKKNTKISKFSRIFNKYSSIIIYILFIFVMILKLLMYYVIPNKIWYLKSSIDKQVVASSDKRTDCKKYIKGQVISSVSDLNYYVYEVFKGNPEDNITLDKINIYIFHYYNNKCNLINILNNDPENLTPSNAINSLILNEGILLIDYHVNPNSGILRKYNIDTFQEDYLVELCNPEDQNHCIIIRKENLINNKT